MSTKEELVHMHTHTDQTHTKTDETFGGKKHGHYLDCKHGFSASYTHQNSSECILSTCSLLHEGTSIIFVENWNEKVALFLA